MVFATSQGPMPAINFAFPDVCLTPMLIPVPIPYPNLALSFMAIPSQFRCLIMGFPVHNMATITAISLGDFPGVVGGVASGMFIGPSRAIMGSVKTFIGGLPTNVTFRPCINNMTNMVGITLSPSQVRVMVLG
jgi:hypothetical protein